MLVLTGVLVDDDTIKLSRKIVNPRGTEVKVEIEEEPTDEEIQNRIKRLEALWKEMDKGEPLPPEFDEIIASGIHFPETDFS